MATHPEVQRKAQAELDRVVWVLYIFRHSKTDTSSRILKLYIGSSYAGGRLFRCVFLISPLKTITTRDITFQKVYPAVVLFQYGS